MDSDGQANSEQELALGDERGYVCHYCSAVLRGVSEEDGPYPHCDPRPSKLGLAYAEARKVIEEEYALDCARVNAKGDKWKKQLKLWSSNDPH